MRSSCLLALALSLGLLACGGGAPAPAKAAAQPAAKPSAPAPAAEAAWTGHVTSLRRAQVVAAIDGGLGVFLQHVVLDDYPVFKSGRFYGFRLKALDPKLGDDLRPGDVIVRVNGRTIERPEEADAALRSLEKAPALLIDYEREGKANRLEIPIVD